MNSKVKKMYFSLLNSIYNVLFNDSPTRIYQSIEENFNTYKVKSDDLSSEIKIINRIFINLDCN
jgi:hypothetical protein